MKHVTKSPEETKELGHFLLNKIILESQKRALVVALEGELGAGKTTFAQGVAKALAVKNKIKSPTFVLIKSYRIKAKSYKRLYHIDCYRLRDHRDLVPLGIKDILSNPENLVLIEWSDRVKKILPKKHIVVHIDHVGENMRKITIYS